jgi:hypothetical protein
VKRKIDEMRELACDEMVTERLVDASTYARTLVSIAQKISTMGRSGYTLGVFDANILEERIMRLINRKGHGGKPPGKLHYLAAFLVLVMSCVTASAFSIIVQEQEKSMDSTLEQEMVGAWKLFPTIDGKADEAENSDPIIITIRMEGQRLVGTAVSHKGDQKTEWQLITPKFDGRNFSFKVYNGEELLEGSMKLKDGVFLGRWTSSESKLSGKLKMIRKE